MASSTHVEIPFFRSPTLLLFWSSLRLRRRRYMWFRAASPAAPAAHWVATAQVGQGTRVLRLAARANWLRVSAAARGAGSPPPAPPSSDRVRVEPAKPAPPLDYRSVAVLTGSQFISNLGFGSVIPVLPLFATEMGWSLRGVLRCRLISVGWPPCLAQSQLAAARLDPQGLGYSSPG